MFMRVNSKCAHQGRPPIGPGKGWWLSGIRAGVCRCNVIGLGNNNASTDRAIIERRTNGLEIVGEAGVIRLKTVRTVEAELARVEVRIEFRLIVA